VQVRVRATEAEYDAICRAAMHAGLTISDYVRGKLGLSCSTTNTAGTDVPYLGG
jgi:hypothetical protein